MDGFSGAQFNNADGIFHLRLNTEGEGDDKYKCQHHGKLSVHFASPFFSLFMINA
jgi:hypothetical protein